MSCELRVVQVEIPKTYTSEQKESLFSKFTQLRQHPNPIESETGMVHNQNLKQKKVEDDCVKMQIPEFEGVYIYLSKEHKKNKLKLVKSQPRGSLTKKPKEEVQCATCQQSTSDSDSKPEEPVVQQTSTEIDTKVE